MLDLIIAVIVIYFIIKRAKAKKDEQKASDRNTAKQSADAFLTEAERSTAVTAAGKRSGSRMGGASGSDRDFHRTKSDAPLSREEIERKKDELRIRLAQREMQQTAEGRQTLEPEQRPEGKAGQQSTTDYLAQKAKEDRIGHAMEKRCKEQRLREETGGRKPALRHYYGDSIPPRMRIVKCSYCAAENLIPERAVQKDYTCYFCRENL